MTDTEKAFYAFISGLEKLTRETGIAITGCGCCGSPYLSEINNLGGNDGYACELVRVEGEVVEVEKMEWITEHDNARWVDESKHIIRGETE